jgi:hypothetical protein
VPAPAESIRARVGEFWFLSAARQIFAGGTPVRYTLPAAGWTASGTPAKVYKFKNPLGLTAAIGTASVDLRKGVLKLKGRGALLPSLASPPMVIDVTVAAGANRYCGHFDATLRPPTTRTFIVKNAPPATACV